MLSAPDLLDVSYSRLGYDEGRLLDARSSPAEVGMDDWLEHGDWLATAMNAGAEKVFFVGGSPVVVFARATDVKEDTARVFNRIWCMGKPTLLFIASPADLAVYDLTRAPVVPGEDPRADDRLVQAVETATQVVERLHEFSRDRLVTGRLFAERHFGDTSADRAMIRDLRRIRQILQSKSLTIGNAHALLGRSILIRYLEDRGIVTSEYFFDIARKAERADWIELLRQPSRLFGTDLGDPLYLKVLGDKEFTYALFRQLAADFNGDIFPPGPNEEGEVLQTHLAALQSALRGEPDGQNRLFFFAYRFDIVPLSLISGIYEEFYQTEAGDAGTQGSHYTPLSLVESVLSQVLPAKVLATHPRIIDPACGSGVFLVEAFRRIIRWEVLTSDGPIGRSRLLEILYRQIGGIELNSGATRVAALSLYLALLHYQKPRDIQEHPKLPTLLYIEGRPRSLEGGDFGILVQGNAFGPLAEAVFGAESADVVVGNPPWGFPKKTDRVGVRAAMEAEAWCARNSLPQGDREPSQAFIHRALHLLRVGGLAGMLVSSGVVYKRSDPSRAFRESWLHRCHLERVINMVHVRDIFFAGPDRTDASLSPFLSLVFRKRALSPGRDMVEYWSARKTQLAVTMGMVLVNAADMHRVLQYDLLRDESLWKLYWWGGHRDRELVNALRVHTPLAGLAAEGREVVPGQGYKLADKGLDADWLLDYQELPISAFHRYGPLDGRKLRIPPPRVERRGVQEVFEGRRLLVKQGISQRGGNKGRVDARRATEPFCFTNSIHGFRLNGFAEEQERLITGIVWSSLARYFYFLTSGSWGTWHHQLHLSTVGELPIHLPDDGEEGAEAAKRVVQIVESLEAGGQSEEALAWMEGALDEAVFDLYELSDTERTLIGDLVRYGLGHFYGELGSDAIKPVDLPSRGQRGRVSDIHQRAAGLGPYLSCLVTGWNDTVSANGEFWWNAWTHEADHSALVVRLTLWGPDDLNGPPLDDGWPELSARLDQAIRRPLTFAGVPIDPVIRIVTSTDIVIARRNEQRLWSQSAALTDLDATHAQAFKGKRE